MIAAASRPDLVHGSLAISERSMALRTGLATGVPLSKDTNDERRRPWC